MTDDIKCPYCLEKISVDSSKCEYCEIVLDKDNRKEKPGGQKSTPQRDIKKALPEGVDTSETDKKKSNALFIALVISAAVFVILGSIALFHLLFYNESDIVVGETIIITNDLNKHADSVETNDLVNADTVEADHPLSESASELISEPTPQAPTPEPTLSSPMQPAQTPPPDDIDISELTQGTISWNGGTYTGALADGLPNGFGTWSDPTGKSYTGQFQEGKITGYGTMIFPGGEMYIGDFKDGKGHGQGTMTHLNGKRVSGTWIDGKYQDD